MAERKRPKWPSTKFLRRRQTENDDQQPYLGFGWELDYFEFLQKRDGGLPQLDAFPIHYEGRKRAARVRSFYGRQDLCNSVVVHWDSLPRGCLPIGDVEIDGDDFDSPTLLTFRWGEHFNKIFFWDNPHDIGPLDPEDPSRLIRVANSLPNFLRSLKNYDDLYYRTFMELNTTPLELPTIMEALRDCGVEEFYDADYTKGKNCTTWSATWEEYYAQISVGHSVKKLGDVTVASSVAKASRCFLAIDACHWDQASALRAVKKALKNVPAFKGAKKAGQTAAQREPYWRD